MENGEPKERDVPTGADGERPSSSEANPLVQFTRAMRDFSGGIAALKAITGDLKAVKPSATMGPKTAPIANPTAKPMEGNASSVALSRETIAAKEKETAEFRKQNTPTTSMPGTAAQAANVGQTSITKTSNELQKSEDRERDIAKGAGEQTERSKPPQVTTSPAPAPTPVPKREEPFAEHIVRLQSHPETAPQASTKSVTLTPKPDADFPGGRAPSAVIAPDSATGGHDRVATAVSPFRSIKSDASMSIPAPSPASVSAPAARTSIKTNWADADKEFPESDIPEISSIPRSGSAERAPAVAGMTPKPVPANPWMAGRDRAVPGGAGSPNRAPRAVPQPQNRSGRSVSMTPPTVASSMPEEWYVPGREPAPRQAAAIPDSPIPQEWAKPRDAKPASLVEREIAAHDANPRDFPARDVASQLDASKRTNAPEPKAIGGGEKSSSGNKEITMTGELKLISMNSEVIGRARATMNGSN